MIETMSNVAARLNLSAAAHLYWRKSERQVVDTILSRMRAGSIWLPTRSAVAFRFGYFHETDPEAFWFISIHYDPDTRDIGPADDIPPNWWKYTSLFHLPREVGWKGSWEFSDRDAEDFDKYTRQWDLFLYYPLEHQSYDCPVCGNIEGDIQKHYEHIHRRHSRSEVQAALQTGRQRHHIGTPSERGKEDLSPQGAIDLSAPAPSPVPATPVETPASSSPGDLQRPVTYSSAPSSTESGSGATSAAVGESSGLSGKHRRKYFLIGAVPVIAVIAAWSVYRGTAYERDWSHALSTDTPQVYADFLEKYPSGARNQEAETALRLARWRFVRQLDSIDAFEKFTQLYPNGTAEAVAASMRLAELRWSSVDKNSESSLMSFLENFPMASNAGWVAERIQQMAYKNGRSVRFDCPRSGFGEGELTKRTRLAESVPPLLAVPTTRGAPANPLTKLSPGRYVSRDARGEIAAVDICSEASDSTLRLRGVRLFRDLPEAGLHPVLNQAFGWQSPRGIEFCLHVMTVKQDASRGVIYPRLADYIGTIGEDDGGNVFMLLQRSVAPISEALEVGYAGLAESFVPANEYKFVLQRSDGSSDRRDSKRTSCSPSGSR